MKFLKNLLSNGGLIAKGLDFVNKRWPPDMSEQQRAQMEVVVKDMLHDQQMELMQAAHEDEKQFNERTIALEGTAKDLKTIPFVGAIVIFLRGAFRPVFAYFTLYLDAIWFTTATGWSEQQNTAMIVINATVLIFFFGERAMKNLMPLVIEVFAAKK